MLIDHQALPLRLRPSQHKSSFDTLTPQNISRTSNRILGRIRKLQIQRRCAAAFQKVSTSPWPLSTFSGLCTNFPFAVTLRSAHKTISSLDLPLPAHNWPCLYIWAQTTPKRDSVLLCAHLDFRTEISVRLLGRSIKAHFISKDFTTAQNGAQSDLQGGLRACAVILFM